MAISLNVGIAAGPTRAGAERLLRSVDLPIADLEDAELRYFFYFGSSAAPMGLVGLELYGEHALLRSLVVAPAARAGGAGSALVEHAEDFARSQGVRELFLLTTNAENFFGRRGYARLDRRKAPESIRTTRQFADICPASSTFMVKQL